MYQCIFIICSFPKIGDPQVTIDFYIPSWYKMVYITITILLSTILLLYYYYITTILLLYYYYITTILLLYYYIATLILLYYYITILLTIINLLITNQSNLGCFGAIPISETSISSPHLRGWTPNGRGLKSLGRPSLQRWTAFWAVDDSASGGRQGEWLKNGIYDTLW